MVEIQIWTNLTNKNWTGRFLLYAYVTVQCNSTPHYTRPSSCSCWSPVCSYCIVGRWLAAAIARPQDHMHRADTSLERQCFLLFFVNTTKSGWQSDKTESTFPSALHNVLHRVMPCMVMPQLHYFISVEQSTRGFVSLEQIQHEIRWLPLDSLKCSCHVLALFLVSRGYFPSLVWAQYKWSVGLGRVKALHSRATM